MGDYRGSGNCIAQCDREGRSRARESLRQRWIFCELEASAGEDFRLVLLQGCDAVSYVAVINVGGVDLPKTIQRRAGFAR